jgi:hypothetical protein
MGNTIPVAIICITSLTLNGLGSKPDLLSDLLQTERLSRSSSFEIQDTSIMIKNSICVVQDSFMEDHLQMV